jgi:hypothetical protein
MGTGLHSYGFSGGGGQLYVGGALVAQALYVLTAAMLAGNEIVPTAAPAQ